MRKMFVLFTASMVCAVALALAGCAPKAPEGDAAPPMPMSGGSASGMPTAPPPAATPAPADAPKTDAPKTDAPAPADAPKTDAPKTEAPKTP